MGMARYARMIFGGAAALFGSIALRWHDADTWQTLRQIWSLPFGTLLGASLMVLQIAGGIAMQHLRTARLAAIVLIVVYSLFSLACIPSIVAALQVYATYSSFFEQFCLLCGAAAFFAATETNVETAAVAARVARVGLGVCATSFALGQAFYLRLTADLVPKWIPPSQMFWAVLTTVAFALAALAILANRQRQLAMRLTLMLGLFGLLVWVPRLIAHQESHENWSEFSLTMLITGASWMVAELRSFGHGEAH
jgi:hypothetical protein